MPHFFCALRHGAGTVFSCPAGMCAIFADDRADPRSGSARSRPGMYAIPKACLFGLFRCLFDGLERVREGNKKSNAPTGEWKRCFSVFLMSANLIEPAAAGRWPEHRLPQAEAVPRCLWAGLSGLSCFALWLVFLSPSLKCLVPCGAPMLWQRSSRP